MNIDEAFDPTPKTVVVWSYKNPVTVQGILDDYAHGTSTKNKCLRLVPGVGINVVREETTAEVDARRTEYIRSCESTRDTLSRCIVAAAKTAL